MHTTPLGRTFALATLVVAAAATRAAAIHPDFDAVAFTPLTCGADEPAGDETPSSLDLVGTEAFPAAQVGHDEEFLYFRYRVNRSPDGPGGFDQFAWVALLQVPGGNPFQYQYAVGLNGAGAPDDFGNAGDTVELWQNTDASNIDFSPIFQDASEVRLFAQRYDFVGAGTGNAAPLARIVPASDGSSFGGDADYFLDFAMPVSRLIEHGVVGAADGVEDLLFFPAVSTNSNNFNKGHLDGCPFLPNTTLEVAKAVTPATAAAGAATPVTYTIAVTNTGLMAGKGIVIEDPAFPSYFTLGSVNATADDAAAAPTVDSMTPLVVRAPLLPPGATVTVEVYGTATPTCGDEPFVNTAVAYGTNAFEQTATATLSVGAGAEELCDGADNDCDGQVDEGGDALCADGNACTADACIAGACSNVATDPACVPCLVAGDCDDADACTADACEAGVCSFVPTDPGCRPCDDAGDCDDADACTADACVAGVCSFTQTPGCIPCDGVADCDDADACTADACVAGVCSFTQADPGCIPCTTDLDCSDGNGCTTDACTEGVCSSVQADPACVPCATAAECDDENACTDDVCNAGGVCENAAEPGCVPCAVDADCADADACTSDGCGEDGSCRFTTIPGCVPCEEDAECADEDACTEDSCFQGACANVPIPECTVCTPEAEVCGDGQDNDCDDLTDCDDPNCDASPQCEEADEICGDCIDNDADGFVDLDDPDCCALSQSIPMKKLRIKTKTRVWRKRLKVKARYAPALPSENFDPLTQDTTFQLSDENGMVYCANLPAAKWRLRDTGHTIFRFKDKNRRVANGLHVAVYREKRKGQVIFRTRGKKIDLDIRNFRGQTRATVRLGDQCSFASAELRDGKNSLVFP